MKNKTFGKLILFGSGETSDSGKVIFRKILSTFSRKQEIAILETPAGFQPNSEKVAQEIANVFQNSLPEFINSISIIPARKKGTKFSPDNLDLMSPLSDTGFILIGPGSPTYAVNHLSNSLLLKIIVKRWRKGATLCFSSAGALACGKFTLPVYEIYKAGEELHWIDGLDLFKVFGIPLTIITHWNNSEGGKDLDTSFCYMGKPRFKKLLKLLPRNQTILGIDENTAMIIDISGDYFYLEGKGFATLINNGKNISFNIGIFYSWGSALAGKIREIKNIKFTPVNSVKTSLNSQKPIAVNELPDKLRTLINNRQEFKKLKKFKKADEIRRIIESNGYEVRDNENGQEIYKI